MACARRFSRTRRHCLLPFRPGRVGPLALLLATLAGPALAESHAPIFVYYQIGRDENPAGNLRVEQFQAQLALLKGEGFSVSAVGEILSAFDADRPLPDRTVGLTFDEASRSIAQNALPLLKQAGYTATIFVTPALADRGGAYMTWDELRQAAHDGFAIGAKIDADAVDETSPEKVLAAVNDSLARIRDMIGVAPTLFAYPDGISSQLLRDTVKSRGFRAAFADQSGPASGGSDRFLLPRFPMTESFGTPDRFRVAALSLPLSVTDVLPRDPTITGTNPPQIGFTLVGDDVDVATVACFVEDQGKVPQSVLGNRVEIRPPTAFDEDDTTRVNCTAPGRSAEAGRWHWLGFDFFVPANDR